MSDGANENNSLMEERVTQWDWYKGEGRSYAEDSSFGIDLWNKHSHLITYQVNWSDAQRAEFAAYRLRYIERLRRLKTVTVVEAGEILDRFTDGLQCDIICKVSGLPISFRLRWRTPKLAIEDHATVLYSDIDILDCLETWQDRAARETETIPERLDLGRSEETGMSEHTMTGGAPRCLMSLMLLNIFLIRRD